MSISVVERVADVAVEDFDTAKCSLLNCGRPDEVTAIAHGSARHKEYKECGKVLRWYVGLMGETSPRTSPLSVDVAGDKDYQVYRYDWVFGVTLPNVDGPEPGELWWDWQRALARRTSVAVQLLILNGNTGLGYTCVASNLNVLPPSRETRTWWQRNKGGVIDLVKSGTQTAEELYPGMITKAVAAISNSLDARGKWRRTNWFIYQFLDSASQACAVEWRINKQVLAQYGSVLRGSLVLAFHGPDDLTGKQEPIRLALRPQLGFSSKDELARVAPKLESDQEVNLEIRPSIRDVHAGSR
jgi:hypothetical protein